MHTRRLFVALLVVSFGGLLCGSALAAKKPKGPDPGLLHGTVVSVDKIKLTLKTEAGKEETHEAADSCSVKVNGKDVQLTELKKDEKIAYTINPDGKLGSVRVGEAKKK